MFDVLNFFLYIKNWFWIFLEFKQCINSIKCWMFTGKKYEPIPYTPPPSTPLPGPPPSPTKSKKGDKKGAPTPEPPPPATVSITHYLYNFSLRHNVPLGRELTLGVVKYFHNYFQKDQILSWKYADIVCFFLITIRISLQLVNHYKLQITNWGYREWIQKNLKLLFDLSRIDIKL